MIKHFPGRSRVFVTKSAHPSSASSSPSDYHSTVKLLPDFSFAFSQYREILIKAPIVVLIQFDEVIKFNTRFIPWGSLDDGWLWSRRRTVRRKSSKTMRFWFPSVSARGDGVGTWVMGLGFWETIVKVETIEFDFRATHDEVGILLESYCSPEP